MIKPTVGRVVLFRKGSWHTDVEQRDQPLAALVAYVWNDRLINVGGFDADGKPFAATSVQLLQDDDAPQGECFAEWMPYQKGQAAKTEQLEQKLAAGS